MVKTAGQLLFLASCLLAAVAHGAIEVEVDRDKIALNETVQIVFRADQQTDAEPDFSPLQADFELLGSNKTSSATLVNNRYTTETRWVLRAMPRKVGVLTIPAIQFGSQRSEPRTINVELPAPGSPGQPDSEVFIEVEATPDQPFVQGEIVLTVRIFAAVRTSNAGLTEPVTEGVDAVVQRTAADRSYEARRAGQVYRVTERNYSIFPQASGRLRIGPMVFSAELGGSRLLWQDPFRRGQAVRVRSEPIELDVRPIPAQFPGSAWLPARAVNLDAGWSPPGAGFRVGEPATLVLKLTAVGLSASQLPTVSLPLPGGLRQYPDQPVTEERWTGRNTVVEQTLRIAIIPGREGTYEIQGLSLPWWNVDTDELEYARLEAMSFVALPGRAGSAPEPALEPAPAEDSAGAAKIGADAAAGGDYWPWLTLALAVGWLLTLALWWHSRKPRRDVPDNGSGDLRRARSAVVRAARDEDAAGTASALLAWGAALWPERPPRSLRELAGRCPEPISGGINDLERALYAPGPARWEDAGLARAVAGFSRPKPKADGAVGGLAPLYPDA